MVSFRRPFGLRLFITSAVESRDRDRAGDKAEAEEGSKEADDEGGEE